MRSIHDYPLASLQNDRTVTHVSSTCWASKHLLYEKQAQGSVSLEQYLTVLIIMHIQDKNRAF